MFENTVNVEISSSAVLFLQFEVDYLYYVFRLKESKSANTDNSPAWQKQIYHNVF